ncbi:uncharacterized protein MYCGRDRAFT_96362 [Zymoseptoria tritici IPO323]|uniref:Uncharacterized protein n=1 Tax=Zymoseptoria tritici (strain CBS 115943 / IPO323) TaxID=336722 RepID=F9XLW0_ZYMTI|nr:uncharacterized protein MYCGRDRAFT_96362 [Zymoseptoria tritici IPO323]EGP83934.1 hypothetical protein MYCGRDRAFT_96362 [Zymoseptoria tritici IPO323]
MEGADHCFKTESSAPVQTVHSEVRKALRLRLHVKSVSESIGNDITMAADVSQLASVAVLRTMSRTTDLDVDKVLRMQGGELLASGDEISWYPREDMTAIKEILQGRSKNKPWDWWKAQAILHGVAHQSEYHKMGEQCAGGFQSALRQVMYGDEPPSPIFTTRDGRPRTGPHYHAPLPHRDEPNVPLHQLFGDMTPMPISCPPSLPANFTNHTSNNEPGAQVQPYTATLSDPHPPLSVFEFDLTLTLDNTTNKVYGVFRIAAIEGVFVIHKYVPNQDCTFGYWAKDFQINKSKTGLGVLTVSGQDGIEGDFANFSEDGRMVTFRARMSSDIKVNESLEVLRREFTSLRDQTTLSSAFHCHVAHDPLSPSTTGLPEHPLAFQASTSASCPSFAAELTSSSADFESTQGRHSQISLSIVRRRKICASDPTLAAMATNRERVIDGLLSFQGGEVLVQCGKTKLLGRDTLEKIKEHLKCNVVTMDGKAVDECYYWMSQAILWGLHDYMPGKRKTKNDYKILFWESLHTLQDPRPELVKVERKMKKKYYASPLLTITPEVLVTIKQEPLEIDSLESTLDVLEISSIKQKHDGAHLSSLSAQKSPHASQGSTTSRAGTSAAGSAASLPDKQQSSSTKHSLPGTIVVGTTVVCIEDSAIVHSNQRTHLIDTHASSSDKGEAAEVRTPAFDPDRRSKP